MNKNKIFGFVNMGAALIMIISIFLPFMSAYSMSASLWKAEDPSRVLFIILGLLVIALYVFNKKTEMSYITSGFGTFYLISMIISAEGLEYFSIGFYLILLSSLTIGVVTFLYDEKQVQPLINLSASVNKPVYNQQMAQPMMNQQPQMAQPMMNQQPVQSQMAQPVMNQQPQMAQPMNQSNIVGYDPNTGAPIYSNQNNF